MRKFWTHLGIILGLAFASAVHSQEIDSPDTFGESYVKNTFAVSAEMPLLSVFANHGTGGGGNNWFNDFDVSPALRVTAAYQLTEALGVRGRFFKYDTTRNATPIDRFDVRLYDVEATTGINVAGWELLGFGGARWGNVNFSNRFSGTFESFDGVGLTCGVDMRREVGCGLALVGGLRQSYIYGDSTVNVIPNIIENTVVPITELRVGIDYTMQLRRGSKLVAGIGFEHQQYSSLSVRNINIDPEDVDVALSGPVFSLTWLR